MSSSWEYALQAEITDMETYTDEDAYDDVTGFHNTSLGDRTKSPPLPPPRKPAHDSHYLNRSFGSVNSLQATGFEKYVEAGSTMSLYDPRYGNTTLSKYTESRLLYYAPRVSGTTERSVPATLPRGPVSPGTMNNSRPIVRVPSEYQLPSEIFLRERAHESYSRFTSTKNLDSVDDRNGMHVKERVFTSEKWTVEELTNMYDKGDIKQKLDITQYIATKGLKFLKGRDIAGVAKLLTIDSNTITAIIVPFLLEKTLELHHTDDVDIVFEALNILSDKFHKDYHSIILIVCNMVCFVHLKSCGQHIRKKEICKKYLHACKTVLSRSKRKSCTSVCCSVLAQFMEQFKSKKDSSNQSHVTENGRKRDTNFRSMGFFEQYSCLFEIINKIFTTATNMTQVEALLEVVGSIVEQKQKPQTDECQKQESLLRLITLSCLFLLKNDNYLDLKSPKFTQRLLDLLKSIFSDKNVLQETRISLIANLEPLLLTENTDIAKHILEMFIKNHRCPVQMSKLVKNFIERELHHTGIKLANDTYLNEQTPNWQAIEGLFMDSREIVVHCLVPTQACLTKGYAEYKCKANKNTTEKHLNNLEILQHLQDGSTHPSIIELFAYQRQPIPTLYIIEKMSSITLNEYLLNKRRRSHWIGHNKLANLACQVIDVLMFLHEKHIIHRGLTSHSFHMCNGGQTLVLHDFSIAIMTENCAESTTGTNCQFIPTLWSSPESILEDKFSMKSDTWMLGHVIYEIFTHGCQPYTEMYTFSIDKILSYVVFHHLKPKRWPCIPPEIYDLIKGAQHYQPKKRMDLSDILQKMKDFVCQSPGTLHRSQSCTSKTESTYPTMDIKQGSPVTGIPSWFVHMKEQSIKDSSAIYNTYLNLRINERSQNTKLLIEIHELTSPSRPRVKIQDSQRILVSESVTAACVDIMREHLNSEILTDILHMVNSPTWHKASQPNVFNYQLEYELKCCSSLTDLAKCRHFGNPNDKAGELGYLQLVLKMVQFVSEMNNRGWILGSIRCSDMYITSDNEKVVMARLSRMLWFDRIGLDDDYVIATDDCSDSMRWCPIDVLQYKQYSFSSDVYSLAMAIYEFYMTISVYQQNPMAEEPECAPFPYISIENLQESLYCDCKPDRPEVCPEWLYHQLCMCWNKDKEKRPTCNQLFQNLQSYIQTRCEPVAEECHYESPTEEGYTEINQNNEGMVKYDEIMSFHCVNSDSDSE